MRRRVSGLGEAGRVRDLALVAVVLVATVASIALRITSPALLQAGATFDDAHFTTLAVRLIDGQWLGPYDFQTLSKGPGYPLFIAATYKAHLPLKLIEHALHLLAAATIGLALAKVSRSHLLGVIAYCVIALDPAYLGQAASVVSRDAFYGTLSLLLVGGTLLFLVSVPSVIRRGPAWAVPLGLVSGGTLGLVTSTYYVTRDERSWLAPALLAAVTVGVASWRRDGKVRWVPAGGALVLAMVGAAASCVWSIDQVASRNEAAYGTTVISDLAEGEIARAYAEWQRVDVGEPKPLVPVTAAQRDALYAVSPAAAELEAHLNGHGRRWIGPDCATASPGGCDYPGGAFVWVLREAAWANGHEPSGAEAQRYFGRMADEIATACGGELPCVDRGIASMPPLSRVDDPWRVVGSFWTGTRYMLSFDTGEPGGPRLSQGTVDQWELMLRPLRGIDESQAEYDALAERAADRQQVVAALTDLYRWAARIGVVPALLGLALGLATGAGRRHWPTVAVGGVMLVALLSRLVLLAVVDATAFEAVRVSVYILPGVDFLVVALVVGWWMLATVVWDEVRLRREAGGTEQVEPEGDGEPRGGAAGGRGHGLRGDLLLRGRG
jgi:hypothetical protein